MNLTNKKTDLSSTRDFLRANIWFIWVAIMLSLAWDVYVDTKFISVVEKATEKMEKSSDKISKGIISLDILGRPIVSQPQQLTPVNPAFKEAILNYIKIYGILDWAGITNNFTREIRTVEDIYVNNPELVTYRDEFFIKDSNAAKDWDAYLTNVLFDLSKDKLPESFSIVDQKIIRFTVKESSFSIEADFTVNSREFDGRTDTTIAREGHVTISAIGKLDPSLGTTTNPLGIRFDKEYKPSILKKRIE